MYLQHDYILTRTACEPLILCLNTVINEVVVLLKMLQRMKFSNSNKDVTENQHTLKAQTQKGICGTLLTLQYLLSGEYKNMIMFYLQVLQILSTFQVNNFHVTMHT